MYIYVIGSERVNKEARKIVSVPKEEAEEPKSQFQMGKPRERVSVANLEAKDKSQFQEWNPGVKVSVSNQELKKRLQFRIWEPGEPESQFQVWKPRK